MRLQLATLVLSAGALMGCAATVERPNSPMGVGVVPAASSKTILMSVTGSDAAIHSADWEPFKGEWRAAMSAAAAAKGAKFIAQEGSPKATGEPGTWIAVNIVDYRYLTPAARFGFGVMTGNAYIESNIDLYDRETGSLFKTGTFSTSSSAWQGIFSAMTDKQVRAICDDVMAEINPR